jgi:dTDP-glucose 4,6-dehydratase
MRILVTGGAGFIGSNFIRYIINKYPDYRILNFDKLTYAGNPDNLKDIEDNERYMFIKGDIADCNAVESAMSGGIDAVVNFAAESHVDRSLDDPAPFMNTNVAGTQVLLDAAHRFGAGLFIQVSTDEVYGSCNPGCYFSEESAMAPSSPYSASKAAADLIALSYYRSFDLPVIVTRCSNNYGPYQFPEKLIPLFITNSMEDKKLPVYGDGLNIRDWINVKDHCRGIDMVLHQGRFGEVYNIGGNNEKTNLWITRFILDYFDKPRSMIEFISDRPAHDRRYAMNTAKIKREIGFEPEIDISEGLKDTIRWYIENRNWWEKIRSGQYLEYYEKHYIQRDKI